MTNEEASDSYPCPRCGATAALAGPCPGCGRAPDPDAAAVVRIDRELTVLDPKIKQARRSYEELLGTGSRLFRQRETHASRVRAAIATEARIPTVGAGQVPVTPPASPAAGWWTHPAGPAAQPGPAAPANGGAEATPRTVQNVLFVLGGLLLGVAAIVFTAVAWVNYGVYTRAAILTVLTIATLSVPPIVRRRGLTGTAETFAALGLLLMLLDGYAAWYVNFAGVAEAWDGSFYAGAVCAGTAAFGFGYARINSLYGPSIIALIVAQPVLPLLFNESSATTTQWALILATLALANLLVPWTVARGEGVRRTTLYVLGWIAHGQALVVAFALAIGVVLTAQTRAEAWRGSAVLLVVAGIFAAGALISRADPHRGIAGATLVLVAMAALVKPGLVEGWDELLVVTGAAALVSTAAMAAVRWRRAWWTLGGQVGAAVALAIPAIQIAFLTLRRAGMTMADATPWWHAKALPAGEDYAWELPVAVTVVGIVAWLLIGKVGNGAPRQLAAASCLSALALAAPGYPAINSWALPAAELTVIAVALALALLARTVSGQAIWSLPALLLGLHVVLATAGESAGTAVTLSVLTLLGGATAALALRTEAARLLGGFSAAVALALAPLAVLASASAVSADAAAPWRYLLAATVMVAIVVHFAPTPYRSFAMSAGALAAVYPLWPDLPAGEPQALYAGAAAAVMGIVLLKVSAAEARWLITLPALVTVAWSWGTLSALLLQPVRWVDRIWTGAPDGVGLSPYLGSGVDFYEIAGLQLLTIAVAVQVGAVSTLRRALVVTAAGTSVCALGMLARYELAWPTVPATALLLGLAALVYCALRPASVSNYAVTALGSWLALIGLAGGLPEEWSTITALSLWSVALATVAIAGRGEGARLTGWLAGAVSKVLLVVAIGAAGDLDLEQTAYLVLGVAALLLAVAYTPLAGRNNRAVEAAAHATALVALAFTHDNARAAAGVLALWGVAIGVTALAGRSVAVRAVTAAVAEALAWVLLLAAAEVGVLEAYTLPVSLLALVLGILAARRDPGLSSWRSVGPALAGALLPSLAAALTVPGDLRKVLLGAGALIIVTVGAVLRRQAPVVLAGAVLVVLALQALFRVIFWDRVQGWIPLAIGGALLVGLAITYERRRGEAIRLREAISRMR